VQTRFYNVLSKIEEEADKWENWDTSLFVLGFLGSLIVTLGTALSLTNFVSQSAISTISTIVLLVSSVASAVLGIRERLKFRERALQARRTATRLQVFATIPLGIIVCTDSESALSDCSVQLELEVVIAHSPASPIARE
jgi:hypothetical protein